MSSLSFGAASAKLMVIFADVLITAERSVKATSKSPSSKAFKRGVADDSTERERVLLSAVAEIPISALLITLAISETSRLFCWFCGIAEIVWSKLFHLDAASFVRLLKKSCTEETLARFNLPKASVKDWSTFCCISERVELRALA